MNKKCADLGKRLSIERTRLGLSQKQLASEFGVHKASVYQYERGDRPPNAAHLVSMYELGADVYFILTGRSMRSSVSPDWLHETMVAIREIDESGAWEDLDWEKKEKVLAMFLGLSSS